jgi:hypothetical protein
MAARLKQVAFFQSKGAKCSYFKAAIRLAAVDLIHKGFKAVNGVITAPGGEQVWPMT